MTGPGDASAPTTAAPLRIGLVTWQFPVLSESFVSTLALDLVARGHDLRVLTFDPEDRGEPTGAQHDEVARSDLLARTGRAGLAKPGGRAPLRRALLRSLPLAGKERAGLVLREGPFDVIHCQFASLGLAARSLRRLRLLTTRCLVVHVRGHDITAFVEERGPRVYDRLFRDADLFIANCRHFQERAIALGCPHDKIITIGSPIDVGLFQPPASREPYAGRPLRLVAVGRLVEKKGFADAIAALDLLRRHGIEAELRILGEGPWRSALEERIERLGLAGLVQLHGQSTQSEIVAALHRADIALAPCVRAASGNEDAPVNTLKEAMATGLPVVATRHGGIPELVVPHENGLLVPEHDPAALAAAIRALVNSPELWPEMGRAGRARVTADYDRHSVCEQTLAAYRSCLERGG